jgi:hypothetical protein
MLQVVGINSFVSDLCFLMSALVLLFIKKKSIRNISCLRDPEIYLGRKMPGLNFKIYKASSSYRVMKEAHWNVLIHVKPFYEVEENLLVADNDRSSDHSSVTYSIRLNLCRIFMKFGMIVLYKTLIRIHKLRQNRFSGSRTLPGGSHEFVFLLPVFFLLICLKFGTERVACFAAFFAEGPTLNCVVT